MNWRMIGQKAQVCEMDNIRYRIDAALVSGRPNWTIKRQCLRSLRWDHIGQAHSIKEAEAIIARRHKGATVLDIKC